MFDFNVVQANFWGLRDLAIVQVEHTTDCFPGAHFQPIRFIVFTWLEQPLCQLFLYFKFVFTLTESGTVVSVNETFFLQKLVIGINVEEQRRHYASFGRPFFAFCNLLLRGPICTKNRQFDSNSATKVVTWQSCVILNFFWIIVFLFTVSFAAVRSTNTAPVNSLFSYASSICWHMLRICPVEFFPGLKPACSGISRGPMSSSNLL